MSANRRRLTKRMSAHLPAALKNSEKVAGCLLGFSHSAPRLWGDFSSAGIISKAVRDKNDKDNPDSQQNHHQHASARGIAKKTHASNMSASLPMAARILSAIWAAEAEGRSQL